MLPEDKRSWLRNKAAKRFARHLRKSMTAEETILWNVLRNRQLCGCKFRRQAPIGPYIVDFLHRKQRLVIEIDGGIHRQQQEYDAAREEYLRARNYKIIRFTNEEILQNLPTVLSRITQALHIPLP